MMYRNCFVFVFDYSNSNNSNNLNIFCLHVYHMFIQCTHHLLLPLSLRFFLLISTICSSINSITIPAICSIIPSLGVSLLFCSMYQDTYVAIF